MPIVRELMSIVNYENGVPAFSDVFNTGCVTGCALESCSWTDMEFYRSSTSLAFVNSAINGWCVNFNDGTVSVIGKIFGRPVHAVRGGL